MHALTRRHVASFAVATLVFAALGSCGSGEPRISAAEGRHYVEDFFLGRNEGASGGGNPFHETLHEALPNVTYLRATGEKGTVSTHALLGRITKVERGKGFRIEGDDAPDGIPTDFDDARSRWRTVHVTIRVEQALGGQSPAEVRFYLPSGPPGDFARMEAGLKGLGRVVVFLSNDTRYNTYDSSLMWVLQERGPMIATVGDDGRLALSPDGRGATGATPGRHSDVGDPGREGQDGTDDPAGRCAAARTSGTGSVVGNTITTMTGGLPERTNRSQPSGQPRDRPRSFPAPA
jgi:hypothetical protein